MNSEETAQRLMDMHLKNKDYYEALAAEDTNEAAKARETQNYLPGGMGEGYKPPEIRHDEAVTAMIRSNEKRTKRKGTGKKTVSFNGGKSNKKRKSNKKKKNKKKIIHKN